MLEVRLTRAELEREANRLGERTFPTGQYEPISERTIRYWLNEDLLPRSGGPRRAARFDPKLIHRCVFIRRLQRLESLSLDQIRQVLHEVDDQTIRRVVENEEPLDLTAAVPAGQVERRLKRGETVIALESKRSERSRRESSSDRSQTDRPRGLEVLSDLVKAEVIEESMEMLAASEWIVEIRSFTYHDRIAARGSFSEPARLVVSIRPTTADASDGGDPLRGIRAIADRVLCDEIARNLTRRTGEEYAVEMFSKNYPDRVTRPGIPSEVRMTLLVAGVDDC